MVVGFLVGGCLISLAGSFIFAQKVFSGSFTYHLCPKRLRDAGCLIARAFSIGSAHMSIAYVQKTPTRLIYFPLASLHLSPKFW